MHDMKKITKCGEKKGFRITHLGVLMLFHGTSLACTLLQCVFFDDVFILQKLKEKIQKMKRIILGCLPISTKLNIFSQTHISSSSPNIYVVFMNQNSMHYHKFPQNPNHNYPCHDYSCQLQENYRFFITKQLNG